MATERNLNQKELAAWLGISTRQVRNLVDRGLPRDVGPDGVTYPWNRCREWYIVWRQEARAARRHDRTAFLEARVRLMLAQATLAELEVRDREAHLVPLEVIREVLGEVVGKVRAELAQLPARWASDLVGLESPREVVKVLHRQVGEAIVELGKIELEEAEEDGEGEGEGGVAASPSPPGTRSRR